MKRDILLFIDDILNSIKNIDEFVKELNREKFSKDILRQSAIIRQLEIIGEAVKNIPFSLREKYPKIQWKDLAGLRDILSHAYFSVILERVWNIIENDLPSLKKEIEKIKLEEIKINCVIIHGCPSDIEKAMDPKRRTYDKHWIPWTKNQLVSKEIKVYTPLMPEPWEPNYEKFKNEFEKYKVDENSILIGHSCGCAFLVRWLGETKQNIRKLILVAPWKIQDKNDKFRKEFYNFPIDSSIKDSAEEIIIFTADDEENDGKESLKIFHKYLGGKIIELKGRGHYTLGDMGTEEFPELIEEILN